MVLTQLQRKLLKRKIQGVLDNLRPNSGGIVVAALYTLITMPDAELLATIEAQRAIQHQKALDSQQDLRDAANALQAEIDETAAALEAAGKP